MDRECTLARAVRLLGARVTLTGIRPEVAQVLVTIGVDMRGIVTHGTLQAGIVEATRGSPVRRAP
jgi:rsbT co-antagonist protein RsbR